MADSAQLPLSEWPIVRADSTGGLALLAGNQTVILQSTKPGVAVESSSPSRNSHLSSLPAVPPFTGNRSRELGTV